MEICDETSVADIKISKKFGTYKKMIPSDNIIAINPKIKIKAVAAKEMTPQKQKTKERIEIFENILPILIKNL